MEHRRSLAALPADRRRPDHGRALIAFAARARRIPLSLLGILQYLGPTLQLALGVFVFHEPLPPAKLAGYALIWLALLLYAGESAWFTARSRGLQPATLSGE